MDPYTDPETGVLRNLLGISDAEALAEAEADLSLRRMSDLERDPLPGRFDLAHLAAIHGHIFQDVYPWAGRVRTVAIAKASTMFCLPQHIDAYATQVFGDLAHHDHLRGLDIDEFVDGLARAYADVNALHPFREGNGRAQRILFSQLAGQAGWRIAWERMDGDDNAVASAAGVGGEEAPLRAMFADLVDPIEQVGKPTPATPGVRRPGQGGEAVTLDAELDPAIEDLLQRPNMTGGRSPGDDAQRRRRPGATATSAERPAGLSGQRLPPSDPDLPPLSPLGPSARPPRRSP